jgi:hypothetical protein
MSNHYANGCKNGCSPPLPTREVKKQCLAKLLKDENVFLSGLIKQLRSENNLFRQRLHFPNSVSPLLRSLSLEYEPEKILHF